MIIHLLTYLMNQIILISWNFVKPRENATKAFDSIHTLDQKRMEDPIMNLRFWRNTKPITLFGSKTNKISFQNGEI
jgi:hypothetical protein